MSSAAVAWAVVEGEDAPVGAAAEHTGCARPSLDDIVSAHLPLVRQVVLQMQGALPPSVQFDEAMSWGIDGLLDACRCYDRARATRFRTYARIRIRGAILDGLRALDLVSRTTRHRSNELARHSRSLEQRLGRQPTQEEVAAALGLGLEELHDLYAAVGPISLVSLDDVAFEASGEALVHGDLCAGGPDPLALLLERERSAELAAAIELLPEKERALVPLYYGGELTMKEVGARLGVTESRVSQLHSQALLRLRRMLVPPAVGALAPN